MDQFQNVVYDTYQIMRNKDFCDVTLVSADYQKLEAHKVILLGSSNVLRNMLLGEKHPKPLGFMGGVEHEVLKALLDSLYSGEAELREEKKESLKNSVRGRHCAYLHRNTNAKRPDSSQPEKSHETVIEDMDEDDRVLMECEALMKM